MKTIFKSFIVAGILLSVAGTVKAQDLLASQAPLDKQMQFVDSIALRNMLLNESYLYPSEELYPEWDNRSKVHYNGNLPDSLRIDLRGFVMPTKNTKITDIFGYRSRRRRVHNGLDIKVQKGDTIYAPFSGKVRVTAYQRRGYGHYIVLRHNNGLETVYAHLSKKLVKENQVVKAGDPIALGGNSGRSTGSHLHFETLICGKSINPALMFDFKNQDVTGDFFVYRKNKHQSVDPKTGKVVDSDLQQYHRVRSGDNLSKIANKYGVSLGQIYKLNKMNSRSVIRPGQQIRYR